jgi:TPR repeat protein
LVLRRRRHPDLTGRQLEADPSVRYHGLVAVMDRLGVGILGFVVACGHATASHAPLSASHSALGPEPEAAANTPPQAPGSAKAKAKPSDATKPSEGKQGRRALYRRSCELGSALGCNDLAILLGSSDPQSLGYLERACTLGLPRGCANWGSELWRVAKTDQEKSRGEELLSRACDAEDWWGCTELGNVVYAARAQAGDSVLGRAHVAYAKGCKLGGVEACVSDGWMLWSAEGAPRDVARATELFRGACEHDNFSGCAALGYVLVEVANNAGELAEGQRYLSLACDHSEAFACFGLGGTLLRGDEQAKRKGRDYVDRACKLGLQNACRVAKALDEQARKPAASSSSAAAKSEDDNTAEDADADEDAE